MNFTYVASDNTAGNAQTLGATGQDIWVKQVIFGTMADGVVVKFYNKTTAYGSGSGIGSTDSANVAAYIAQPTAAAGKNYDRVITFGEPGLPLDGGSFHTNASNVTVIWDVTGQQPEDA